MVISPKPKPSSALVGSSVAPTLPTLPFGSAVESSLHPSLVQKDTLEAFLDLPSGSAPPSLPIVPQESYTILRTLHRTQTSHLSLAVASGCAPSTRKSTFRHALYAIRTYRLPLSQAGLVERAALEVLCVQGRGENPYVQRASRFWDDGQTLFIVLEHCGGGNLMGLIQAEGPVDNIRTKRWACEIASGIEFIHNAGVIHNDIRPSAILFRVNGHVCISGFEHSIVLATCQSVTWSVEDRQGGPDTSPREWCMAPELLLGQHIGPKVDCWAFGAVLIWMITGRQPRYHGKEERPDFVRDCITSASLLPIAPLEVADTAVEHLITRCLDRSPSKRPTIGQIKAFEWFADIDWDDISLVQGPDIPITLPTPDLSSEVPTDIPSTIIAPDSSLSSLGTEMEIERSLLWTPARIGRAVGHVSPGATTIASGYSAILSHTDTAPLTSGRPHNPSPPSLLGTLSGGDTPTLRSQQQNQEERSFPPHLSEAGCGTGVGSSLCIDEFGTFLSEDVQGWEESEDSSRSPEISLQDALALPIPLLITPRASEPELHATPGLTRARLPARLLRWRSSSCAGAAREVAVHSRENGGQESPELSWHGLDEDPFRCSPPPSVPTEERETGGWEDTASSRRVDTTFRWSTASLEMEPSHEHDFGGRKAHAHPPTLPFATLTALTRRLREQGRALLRKSRSNVLLPRPRLPSPSVPSPLLRAPPPPPRTATPREEIFALSDGDGGVQRIGLGIGFSLPSRNPSPRLAVALQPVFARREYSEEAVPAGCYAGLGGRRGRKNATQQQLELPRGTDRPTQSRQRCESGPGQSSYSERGPVIGNSGFGEIAVPNTLTEHLIGSLPLGAER
ncbi:kinase-like domain-containing protein [Lactarius pseudohatsudake]|nr:kinase-like domain-containing protein [Lactarius pseudohatsudake]